MHAVGTVCKIEGLPRRLSGKSLPARQETQVRSLGGEDPLEEGTATLSSILAWRIPWTEEPGRLQSVGSPRVGHDKTVCAGTHIK